jgi:peptide deformylase
MAEAPEFEVVLYPDPVLRKVSEPETRFDAELKEVVEGMFARMRKSKGVGLAAPQVGLRRRILVLNPTGDPKDDLVLVNPTIVARFGSKVVFDEGCLSFPGIYAEVTRPDRCTVRSVDLEGRPVEKEYSGFVGRIIQHEHDHLEGILLVDRMSPAEKLKHKAALDELVARYRRSRPAEPSRREAARQE